MSASIWVAMNREAARRLKEMQRQRTTASIQAELRDIERQLIDNFVRYRRVILPMRNGSSITLTHTPPGQRFRSED